MYMYGDMMHPNKKDDIGLGTEAIGMPPRPPFTCHARVKTGVTSPTYGCTSVYCGHVDHIMDACIEHVCQFDRQQ